MKIVTYLNFNNQCKEAFEAYEQILGGKIGAMMSFADMPGSENMPAGSASSIMHARLDVGDQVLMGSDCVTQYEKPAGIYPSLHMSDVAEGERIFNALAEGGKVEMPFEPTFWAAGFGAVTDRFGIYWLINVETAS